MVLLHKQERNDNALPGATPLQYAVSVCFLPGKVHHLKWWLTHYFVNNVDLFHMYEETDNNEQTQI